MRDKIGKFLYQSIERMFENDPHGEHEEQLQYEYWAGKMHAYADVLQLIQNEEMEA